MDTNNFRAEITTRKNASGRWTAVTVLTGGSKAATGDSHADAVARLLEQIPGCYTIVVNRPTIEAGDSIARRAWRMVRRG